VYQPGRSRLCPKETGGVVWGRGLNGQGLLGDGTTSPSAIPMQIPGLSGIAAGLVLGSVSTAVDNTCNHRGTVMRQNPAAGAHVGFGSAVSITIGGPPKHPCP
jgi:hypothetical protein